MASAYYVYISGKSKWMRHIQPVTPKFGAAVPRWQYVHYFADNTELDKFRELQGKGVKNVIKKDDDGWFVNISRPTEIRTKQGRIIGLKPPIVLDKDGKTQLHNVNVGNGSDITTKLRVYPHGTPTGGQSWAVTWESTRIDNLVEFKGMKEDFMPDEKRQVEGLPEQPAPLF